MAAVTIPHVYSQGTKQQLQCHHIRFLHNSSSHWTSKHVSELIIKNYTQKPILRTVKNHYYKSNLHRICQTKKLVSRNLCPKGNNLCNLLQSSQVNDQETVVEG